MDVEEYGAKALADLANARAKYQETQAEYRVALTDMVGRELALDRLANRPAWGCATRIYAVLRRRGIKTSRRTVARIVREHYDVMAKESGQ